MFVLKYKCNDVCIYVCMYGGYVGSRIRRGVLREEDVGGQGAEPGGQEVHRHRIQLCIAYENTYTYIHTYYIHTYIQVALAVAEKLIELGAIPITFRFPITIVSYRYCIGYCMQ